MTKGNETQVTASLKVAFLYGLMTTLFALVLFQQALAHDGPGTNPMDRKIEFDIAARTPLEDALIEWGTQSGIAVMINTHAVSDKTTAGVRGTLSAREALSLLLEGSGLSYKENGSRVMVIPIKELNHVSLRNLDVDVPAQITATSPERTDSGYDTKNERKLEQITVTAQKRSEDVLEVPVAMSVVSGTRLSQLQVNSLVDLDSYVPGLSIEGQGAPGAREIVLRGLSAGYAVVNAGPTVATYIDEIPFGASNGTGRSNLYGADLQPYDVAQVEVLKGPQGTLYGASTLAGLIKYRLIEPDLKRLDIVAGTSTEYIDAGGKPGWAAHGAISLPIITDILAVRLSGFKKETAGYIDNVLLGMNHVNTAVESGGLASILWKPTEAVTVKGTVLAQDVNAAGQAAVNLDPNTQRPLFGPQKEAAYFPEPLWNHSRAYALTLNWDVGFATLTSATGYSSFVTEETTDISSYGIYCDPNAFPGNVGCPDYPHGDALAKYIQADRVFKFTQETRLTSPENQRIQWMVGGYYSRERGGEREYSPAFTPSYQQLPSPQNDIVDDFTSGLYSEAAAFGNVTFKITDRWDITGGERYSRYRVSDGYAVSAGLFGCATCPGGMQPGGSTGVSVWMGNVRFHLSEDTLLYVRVSTGYQPGYFAPPMEVSTSPPTYTSGVVLPSKTTTYEGGVKARLLDDRLEVDAAGFTIDWKDMQTTEITPQGFGYPANAGSARSTGAELAAVYELIRGLRINGTLAYTDARLTEDVFSAFNVYAGKNGDQLAEAPLWAGSVSLDYEGPLAGDISWLSGVSYRYRDKVDNQFGHTGAIPDDPSSVGSPYAMGPQNTVNLYTGLGVQNLTVKLYATNVFNDRAYSGLLYSPNPAFVRYVPIQPRTVGLGLECRF